MKSQTLSVVLIFALFQLSLALLQKGIGEPCSNREFWSKVQLREKDKTTAATWNKRDMRPWNDTLYLEYQHNGVRTNGETMMYNRQRDVINSLVFAECVEYKGQYINKIKEYLNGLAKQPSWTFSASDNSTGYSYFNGKEYFIELNSAEIAGTLAQSLYLLNSSLDQDTIKTVKTALIKRVIEPVRKYLNGEKVSFHDWWFKGKSNWNAVCWSGVIVTALTTIDNETERQRFLDAAIENTGYYLESFAPDGFASEGVGYFTYGFSGFIVSRQIIMEATNGTKDLFVIHKRSGDCAASCLEFPMSKQAMGHFGDDRFTTVYNECIIDYISSAFASKLSTNFKNSFVWENYFMGDSIGYALQQSPKYRYVAKTEFKVADGSTKYYKDSGIMVSRPDNSFSGKGLAVTIKLLGGTHEVGHNHDDAGSYSISLNGVMVTGEVGGPQFYNSDTFGDNRPKSVLINSYGHPVPYINQKKQSKNYEFYSKKERPSVLSQSSNAAEDKITYDLTDAYAVKELKELRRSMTYTRTPGKQSVVILDEVSFNSPSEFEVAMTTKGEWKVDGKPNNNVANGIFELDGQKLSAKIDASHPFTLLPSSHSEFGNNFTRIAIRFDSKISSGNLRVTYVPV